MPGAHALNRRHHWIINGSSHAGRRLAAYQPHPIMNKLITAALDSEIVFFVFAILLLLGAAELGFRCGLRVFAKGDDARRKLIGGIEAASLGLLALLLGFTFALALNRFDRRRELVVKEANAIGTTWLRASLLPEPHRAPVRDLLRRYVDARIQFHGGLDDAGVFAKTVKINAEMQGELWSHAEAAARQSRDAVTALFVGTVNETARWGAPSDTAALK